MKTYEVAVTWEQSGTLHIKAISLDEAMNKAKEDIEMGECNLPFYDAEISDGSIEVNEQATRALDEIG